MINRSDQFNMSKMTRIGIIVQIVHPWIIRTFIHWLSMNNHLISRPTRQNLSTIHRQRLCHTILTINIILLQSNIYCILYYYYYYYYYLFSYRIFYPSTRMKSFCVALLNPSFLPSGYYDSRFFKTTMYTLEGCQRLPQYSCYSDSGVHNRPKKTNPPQMSQVEKKRYNSQLIYNRQFHQRVNDTCYNIVN